MNFWLSPLHALYNLSFYREVVQAKLSRGFLYLAYLSGFTTLIFLFGAVTATLPIADQAVDWLRKEMPTLVWSGDQLTMRERSPYVLIHPEWGLVAVFDMDASSVTQDDLEETPIFVTSEKVYVRDGANGIRVHDLTELLRRQYQDAREPMVITGEMLEKGYRQLKPWLVFLGAVFYYMSFYLWSLFAALIYSVVGLMANKGRIQKLSYANIYNVSLFALTAAAFFDLLRSVVPGMSRIPFGFLGSLIVTSIYLFVILRKTDTTPDLA